MTKTQQGQGLGLIKQQRQRQRPNSTFELHSELQPCWGLGGCDSPKGETTPTQIAYNYQGVAK